MSGFTKGPWMVCDKIHGHGKGIVHIRCGYNEIGTMFDSGILGDYEEFIANTNLIAAAPELYEALKYMVDMHEEYDLSNGEVKLSEDQDECIKLAYKALKKARGE